MCKKLIFLVSLVLVLGSAWTSPAEAVDPDLVGWWKFDEGSGTLATDSSGRDMHGVLGNDPVWDGDGVHKGCLFFDGDQAHVRITHHDSLNPAAGSFTFAFWAYVEVTPGTRGSTNWDLAVNKRDAGSVGYYVGADRNQGSADQTGYRFMLGDTAANRTDTAFVAVPLEEWVFVAAVLDRDQNAQMISVDGGQTWATTTPPPGSIAPAQDLGIGWDIGINNYWFHGRIDDVRLYSRPLSAEEILVVMEGGGEGYPFALRPVPEDGALLEATWTNLSWIPGSFAVSHDLYFGTSFDNVNDGAEGTFVGNLGVTFQPVGFPGFPAPDGLQPGTTYYWRIDEVNDADPNSPWKGNIWRFSIAPKTAYNPDPVDGAEFVDPNTVKLSWTPGFGAKLHTVYFGDDFDTVSDAVGGMPGGLTTYNPGPLEPEKVYYWRVDEFDGIGTYKGDVWTFTTPGAVGNPQPANGATNVGMNAILSWAPADSVASHELYFGMDKDVVRNADTGAPEYKGSIALGAESYDPGSLDADTTYYWRVDTVDDQGNTAKGPIWIFTTGAFLLVDDFESYTDDDVAGEAIWQTWIDGFGVPDNGAQVGYLMPPYAEQTVVHDGSQSMPLLYVNETGVTNSEASMTLTAPKDWTRAGVAELSLWFRGASANAAEPLYAAISNDAGAPAVVAYDDAAAAASSRWIEWRIALQAFADQGINLTNVDKIGIGLGTKAGVTAPGGTGTIFIDDIVLSRSAP